MLVGCLFMNGEMGVGGGGEGSMEIKGGGRREVLCW